MWTSPAKLGRAQMALGAVNVFALGASTVVLLAGDIRLMPLVVVALVAYYVVARFAFRCSRCGKSPLLWSARHAKSSRVMDIVSRPDCPYCGFDVSPAQRGRLEA